MGKDLGDDKTPWHVESKCRFSILSVSPKFQSYICNTFQTALHAIPIFYWLLKPSLPIWTSLFMVSPPTDPGLDHLGDTPGSSLSLSCTCKHHYCVYVSPDLPPLRHPGCHTPLVSHLHQSRRFPSPPLGSPQTQGWGPTKLRRKRSTRYITFHMIWENNPCTLKIIRVNTYRALTMFQVQFYVICVVQHFWSL